MGAQSRGIMVERLFDVIKAARDMATPADEIAFVAGVNVKTVRAAMDAAIRVGIVEEVVLPKRAPKGRPMRGYVVSKAWGGRGA